MWHGFTLSPFQRQAIRAVRGGRNVLVGAPTGAGKTLVAEFAIEDAVRLGRRCIYTSPIKALSNQKYRDFRDDPNIDVGLMTGDVTIHPGAQVLIMTTEILRNAIFEDPDRLNDVEYVIFDEVHFLDDRDRGCVWEEALIFAPGSIRFICLSATISNIVELGAWIESIRPQGLEVIESHKRPVPLQHAVWTPKEGLMDLEGLRKAQRRAKKRAAEDRGRDKKGRSGRGRSGRGPRDRRGRPQRAPFPEPEALFDSIQEQNQLPVLVFCFSRKDCERIARRNRHRDLLNAEEHERMEVLQRELLDLFQLGDGHLRGEVLSLARQGVGYHHAGMLPIDKELVERMFTSGLLRLLITTETFALGINMPARAVVFNALRKFDGVQVDWLRTREYLQMAGRAGRQGLDTEGLVYSLVGDDDLAEAPLERILCGEPEEVHSHFKLAYSSILHLVDSMGRERILEAWEKSFDQFQHQEASPSRRSRQRRLQAARLDARLQLLQDLRYIDDRDRLTARGRVARSINGYEVTLTELLFRGVLENQPPRALALVAVGFIYEERRRGGGTWIPRRVFGDLRREVDRVQSELTRLEVRHRIDEPMKCPDWGLSSAVLSWFEGADLAELEEQSGIGGGDICRTFRMAIQLLRQVRRAIDPAWDLHELLGDAMAGLDRDEIDARRQLELG